MVAWCWTSNRQLCANTFRIGHSIGIQTDEKKKIEHTIESSTKPEVHALEKKDKRSHGQTDNDSMKMK